MSDYLLSLSGHPFTRGLVRGIGMPTPQALARAGTAYEAHPFENLSARLGGQGPATAALRTALNRAGAELGGEDAPAITVFDASGLSTVAGLKTLYEFFHHKVPQLAANARVVVVSGCPEQAADSEQAAVWRAVEGFTRSLAKEIGKRGATANLLYVEPGAEERLEGPLRFFASARSAYVDGQPVRVSSLAHAPPRTPLTAPLAGKIALVTGGARGIGAATAQRLAEEGARVICADLPHEDLDATAAAIQGRAFGADLTQDSAPAQLAGLIASEFGGVDVIVHNAGITRDKTVAKMAAQQWEQCLAVNLEAVIRLDREFERRQLLRDHGRVVCLSSIAGVAGNVGQTNYASAKAGVIGYVAAEARRLASRGVCVNAIAPGYIETRMMLAVPFLFREFARRANSLSQGGVPRDAAELITFLSTPGAVGITGQTIRVCGQNLIGA